MLNRARWSSRELSRRLLGLLVQVFVPADGPVLVGLDETIERRRGATIAAKGIYRDPVRSSKTHFVKASGLRWISMQVLVEIPWAGRIWGLPFLTVLAPSERSNLARGRRHKTLPEWGRQMIRQPRRWLPDRALIVVADSTYAVLELLADPTVAPTQLIAWFVTRWQVEVTFHEARAHLGVETQRQWSDVAILRTTPALLGLFSLVTLFAAARLHDQPLPVRQAAWYAKTAPTFSDTLAFIRQQLWPITVFSTSPSSDDVIEIPRALFDRLTDTLAFAA